MKKREAENISTKIVKALVAERERKKVSRYRIAKDTGLSESSLSYIEKKSQQPSLPTLLMIADCLDVDLGKIITKINTQD